MALNGGQSALCRGSRGVFVDALIALPHAGSDSDVRRGTELLFGDAAKLAGRAKLDGTDFSSLPGILEQIANTFSGTGTFNTSLAVQAEALFNTANDQCGWDLPDFDSANPGIPPRAGTGGMEI